MKIVGRSASPWPAGQELARLGPPFHGLADQLVYEVHGGAPVQKISVSAANGSFNPCVRLFGHNFCICLYIQFIGVYWRVPNGLVARYDVLGKGVGPAGLLPLHGRSSLRNICIRTPNWVNQVSNSLILTSSSTWKCQIWHLTMFIVVPSYIHVSQSLHMLHLVLFLAYSERNLAKHFRPPKLVEFVSLKQIMHRNIFIPLCLPRRWWSMLSLTTTNTCCTNINVYLVFFNL